MDRHRLTVGFVIWAITALVVVPLGAPAGEEETGENGDLVQPVREDLVPPELHTSDEISSFFEEKRIRTRGIGSPDKTRGIQVTQAGAIIDQKIDYNRVAAFRIYFEHDSARVSPESYPLIREIVTALRGPGLQTSRFYVNGHTDSVGTDPYNMTLSMRRALAVTAKIVELGGIDPARLEARGFGERLPIAPNTGPGGRARNRRVELELRNATESAR